MDKEELENEIELILNPEPDDGLPSHGLFAPSTLRKKYKDLDFSYLDTWDYEGSTMSPHSRICPPDEKRLPQVEKNLGVPEDLFHSALQIFGDSIVTYYGKKEREGRLRFYPPVILTFWSGFETFVRSTSERFLIASKVPAEVRYFLLEEEAEFDNQGQVKPRTKFRPVLERYRILLKYAYGIAVDKNSAWWKGLVDAQKLRDYYTHLDVGEVRTVPSFEVLDYMETILVAVIYPSVQVKRTIMLSVYYLYDMVAELRKHAELFTEQPVLKNMNFDQFQFYCNFDNVDNERFPNSAELMERHQKEQRAKKKPGR